MSAEDVETTPAATIPPTVSSRYQLSTRSIPNDVTLGSDSSCSARSKAGGRNLSSWWKPAWSRRLPAVEGLSAQPPSRINPTGSAKFRAM